jgi:hypothetical protein
MAGGNMMITLVAQTKGFRRGMHNAANDLLKFSKRVAVGASAVIGATAAMGMAAGKMASDFEQSVGGVEAIFKKQSDQVAKFAETAATKMGLSMEQYNRSVALTGTLLKKAGVPMDKLAGKTNVLVQRAADLAATYGGTVEEAATAMSAALRGEFEPIRRFGVALSVAEINQRALADSGKKNEKQLTKTEKIAAAYQLILEQSADAAGQFARESDTLAGQQAILNANLKNIGISIGQEVLPVLSELVGQFTDWLMSDATQKGIEDFKTLLGDVFERFKVAFNDPAVKESFNRLWNGATKFIEFLESPRGKKAIADFAKAAASSFAVINEVLMLMLFFAQSVVKLFTGDFSGMLQTFPEWKTQFFPKYGTMEAWDAPAGSSTWGTIANTGTNSNPYAEQSRSKGITVNFNTPVDSVSAGKSVARVLKNYNRMNGRYA